MFRKVIAASVGRPQEFDWRHFPAVANVSQTIDGIKTFLTATPPYPPNS
jgi:hypothetical protein